MMNADEKTFQLEFAEFVESFRPTSNPSKPDPTPAPSKEIKVEPNPVVPERKEKPKTVTHVNPAPAPKKTVAPKKIISNAQEKTTEVGKTVRQHARETKEKVGSALSRSEDRINAFIDKIDKKLRGE